MTFLCGDYIYQLLLLQGLPLFYRRNQVVEQTKMISYYTSILSLILLFSLKNLVCCEDPTFGFSSVPLTQANFKLQKPYDIPLDQRYSYKDGVHRLWVYADDKPHNPNSNTQPRTEIRIQVLFFCFDSHIFIENFKVDSAKAKSFIFLLINLLHIIYNMFFMWYINLQRNY